MQPGHYQFFLLPPKKSLLKSSYPKKYLPNFGTQNPRIKNFKPKKILQDHLCHLKSQVSPLGFDLTTVQENRLIFQVSFEAETFGWKWNEGCWILMWWKVHFPVHLTIDSRNKCTIVLNLCLAIFDNLLVWGWAHFREGHYFLGGRYFQGHYFQDLLETAIVWCYFSGVITIRSLSVQ